MKKGFSLLEMLVVMGIMAVVATLGFNYFIFDSSEKNLQKEALRLQNVLENLRMMSSTGQKVNGVLPKMYCVYARYTPESGYQTYAEFGDDAIFNSGDEIISTIIMDKNVVFMSPVLPFSLCYVLNNKNYSMCFHNNGQKSCGDTLVFQRISLENAKSGDFASVDVNLRSGVLEEAEFKR
ncbi:MAG: type II secretion system protein [Patescibacteria group bacterium]